MSRYAFLLNILDRIRNEAVGHKHAARYIDDGAPESLNQGRSRAFIHLFLKVEFGLLDFGQREHFVTDGSYDGGIDGYFLAEESKTIYLIQSKFRTTDANFADKEISLDEILAMDIDRISRGGPKDEEGNAYNGKILQLEREVSEIPDVGRWKYAVVILANLHGYTDSQIRRLAGNFPVTVYDAERCYSELVFPVICGTYYTASELTVHLDLSNKYSGTKISYMVATEFTDCEITVVFVPIQEIAKVLHRYKNSILKFNPRSYLELDGKKVNTAIRNTVLGTKTNEFALFNNGITMMSDATGLNERIGKQNKAQLTLSNPQIINGGQTAYTLSRLYEELTKEEMEEAFAGKEVLLKIITLIEREGQTATAEAKASLIDRISSATNQQTTVINADKFANDQVFLKIQEVLFTRYSLLFERKRGEFADGIYNGYAKADQVIERNLFFRLFLAVRGDIQDAIKKRLFMSFDKPERTIEDLDVLDRVAYAFWLYQPLFQHFQKRGKLSDRDRQLYAEIYVLANRDLPASADKWEDVARTAVDQFEPEWDAFIAGSAAIKKNFWRNVVDPKTGKATTAFSAGRWISSNEFLPDVRNHFQVLKYGIPEAPFVTGTNLEQTPTSVERELRRHEKQGLITLKEAGTDFSDPRNRQP